jgi:hypothetical protein
MAGPATRVAKSMDGEIVLIAGLPGSGKTCYLSEMEEVGWLVFDDYKREGTSLEFRNSPRFQQLREALNIGSRCIVADIHFCKTESREEAERELGTEIPGVRISWRFFENDLSSCELNIRRRGRCTMQSELGYLQEYSPVYRPPKGAIIMPVWKGADNQAANGNRELH